MNFIPPRTYHDLAISSPYHKHAFERLYQVADEQGIYSEIRDKYVINSAQSPVQTFEKYLVAADELREQGCGEIGCLLGEKLDASCYGLFLVALYSSRSLSQSLDLVCKFSPKLDFGLKYDLTLTSEEGVLRFLPSLNGSRFPWLVEEWVFGSLGLINTIAKEPIFPTKITLMIPEPRHLWFYQERLICPIEFASNENAIYLTKEDLGRQISSSDNYINKLLSQLILASADPAPDNLLIKLYQYLLINIGRGLPTQVEVALYLGMSTASLKRRLAQQQKTYRQIVLEVRMTLAYEYLLMSKMSVHEAAYLLHYENPANFTRAFKTWFGKTPSQFRTMN
ncbi:helix-turn-helix domain-containing protein [Vibrio cionasavignyae]